MTVRQLTYFRSYDRSVALQCGHALSENEGYDDPDWEFEIRWDDDWDPPLATIDIDSHRGNWRAFSDLPELFAALAELASVTVESVCQTLDAVGFVDITEPHRKWEQATRAWLESQRQP